jgi:hypothetical protein
MVRRLRRNFLVKQTTAMTESVNILAVRLGKAPIYEQLPNSLEAIQGFVKGDFEFVQLDGLAVVVVCNEDGIRLNLKRNLTGIRGDFFLCKLGDEELASITEEEARALTLWLLEHCMEDLWS